MTRMVITLLIMANTFASPTELGNGNDGKDLIEFSEINEGKIFEARSEAVKLLTKINLRGIQGLGYLKDEVEKTKLYETKKGLSPQELLDLGAFKQGSNPVVYARTFPRPHAPTRFFPAANGLSMAKLVAVHIHEGLHRALPQEIRQDEEKVEEVTKVITSPDSTFEDIVGVMNRILPAHNQSQHTKIGEQVSPQLKTKLKKSSFFSETILTAEAIGFGGALPSWQSMIKYRIDGNIYRGEKYSFNTAVSYARSNGSFSEYTGEVTNIETRLEKKQSLLDTLGFQMEIVSQSSSRQFYNDPLSKSFITLAVDWQRKYNSLTLLSKARYTSASFSQGSLASLKNTLYVDDEYGELSFNSDNPSNGDEFTETGSIATLDLIAQKHWSPGFSNTIGMSFHKLTSYKTEYSGYLPNSDDPGSSSEWVELTKQVESIPILSVLNIAMAYKWKSASLRLDYNFLLKTHDIEGSEEVDLSTLGDPMGRGLGRSSTALIFSMTI